MAVCDTCGGDGVIYDYHNSGDPCPECANQSFGFNTKMKIRTERTNGTSSWPCSVIVLAFVLAVVLTAVAATRFA